VCLRHRPGRLRIFGVKREVLDLVVHPAPQHPARSCCARRSFFLGPLWNPVLFPGAAAPRNVSGIHHPLLDRGAYRATGAAPGQPQRMRHRRMHIASSRRDTDAPLASTATRIVLD
jgi:hypothetical protein